MEDLLEAENPKTSDEATRADHATAEAKPSFLNRFAYPIMLFIGVVAAGGISFLVQSGTLNWNSGHSAGGAAGGPRMVRVVYIDTGQIMADALKSDLGGNITNHEAARMGHVIGQVVQEAAAGYAKRGDIVLSRNVLAAPESNNVTAQVEAVVQARLAQDFGNG